MKRNARWGFFAILLAAVLASGSSGATTLLFPLGAEQAEVDAGGFPLPLSDTARRLALPDGPPVDLPASVLVDWPKDHAAGEVTFGMLRALPPISAEPRNDRHGVAADIRTRRPRLSEREVAVWKSNDEPEDWLFRLQFAKASIYEESEPSPLIPIPEPTSGALFLMGLAGRMIHQRFYPSPDRDA